VSLDLPEGVREHAEHHGYEVEEADMHCTGLPDGAFDLVWSHHCLEHSFSPFAALLEWRRLLRPGGYLAVTVPPHKTEIVSGHFIVGWTTGQLLYVLGCTGYAVGQGRFVQQGYNIRALVRKEQQFNPEGKSYLCELKSLLPSSLARNLKDLPRSLGRYSFEGKLLEVTPRRVVCPPEKKEPSQREASPSLVSRLAARVRRFLGRHR
jgi:SAM-dependent methyltransferase